MEEQLLLHLQVPAQYRLNAVVAEAEASATPAATRAKEISAGGKQQKQVHTKKTMKWRMQQQQQQQRTQPLQKVLHVVDPNEDADECEITVCCTLVAQTLP